MHDLPSLTKRDRLILTIAAVAVSLPAVLIDHPASTSEAILGQSLREMEGGFRLTPTVGGLPRLEVAPLAVWMAGLVSATFGVSSTLLAVRLTALIPVLPATFWTASFATTCFGRRIGLLSGFVLVTTFGFAESIWHGSSVAWLTAAGAGFMNLLASLETKARLQSSLDSRPVGSDGLLINKTSHYIPVFGLLAFATMLAGPMAALVTIIVPALAHAMLRIEPRVASRKRTVLTLLVVAALSAIIFSSGAASNTMSGSWPGRLIQLPLMTLPWLPLTIFGQWILRHDAFAGSYSRERLLACWAALVPLMVLCIPRVDLNLALASAGAWSVSAAIGLERFSRFIFSDLPTLQSKHNREVLQRFVAGCTAVFSLTIVWSDRGGNPEPVDRQLVAEARETAEEQGHPIAIDMNLGDEAAVLLFELGNLATPHNVDNERSDTENVVVVTSERLIDPVSQRDPERLYKSDQPGRLAILRFEPTADSAVTRIAAGPEVPTFRRE